MPDRNGMALLPPLTRLGEATFAEDVAPVYERALAALEAAHVPYLLGGALAFNSHTGIWRDTKDLDVFCEPGRAKALLAALRTAGFRTEVVYESWLGKGWMGDVFVDVIWRNANGLFPVTSAWYDNARTIRLLGHDVRVVPVEELVLSKIMVGGRYRFDGADILHVFYAAGDEMDWDRLVDESGEHAGLLLAYMHMYRWGYPAARDKVPDAAIARATRAAEERPSTLGPFRALLMDIQSYRVDVEGWGLPDPHKQVLGAIFGEADGRS